MPGGHVTFVEVAVADSAAEADGVHSRVGLALRTGRRSRLDAPLQRWWLCARPVGSNTRNRIGRGAVAKTVVGLAEVAVAVPLGAPHLGALNQTLFAGAHVFYYAPCAHRDGCKVATHTSN